MKVKFVCNSGANIHSSREELIDLADYFDTSEEEAKRIWESMTDQEKYKEVEQWAFNSGLEIYFDETEQGLP